METAGPGEQELRERAVERLKKKSDFRSHLTSYVLVNAFLVGIWAFTGQGYFWPIWSILGWGVGVGFHAWDAYGNQKQGPSEDQIRREIDKLR